jgi:hypothetical protein
MDMSCVLTSGGSVRGNVRASHGDLVSLFRASWGAGWRWRFPVTGCVVSWIRASWGAGRGKRGRCSGRGWGVFRLPPSCCRLVATGKTGQAPASTGSDAIVAPAGRLGDATWAPSLPRLDAGAARVGRNRCPSWWDLLPGSAPWFAPAHFRKVKLGVHW